MNFDTIRMFCDLVELQNFSRTAEKHYVSQSAVSQQLAQLELVHKCQLINRKKRPLATTASGELFYLACKDMLERYDKFNSELAVLSQSTALINLAAIFSIGMHTLQPYVKRFMSNYPKVKLNVDYYPANLIYDSILKGDIDIGIVASPKKDRNIEVYPFEDEQLVLVCGREHPFANESILDIHQLQSVDFIAFEKGVPTRTLIDNIFLQFNVTVRTIMEFDNIETIKRAVEINSGVSILPETTIRTELANGTLKAIEFSNERFYRPTGVIFRKNKTMTKPMSYLVDLLRKKHDEDE